MLQTLHRPNRPLMYPLRHFQFRSKTSERGSALTELAIVLPLILLPLLAVVTDYVISLNDYQVMLRAARAGGRAAMEMAKVTSLTANPGTDTSAIIFDAAESAIKDYLNGCNHLIPGDCNPAVHNEQAYRIEMRGQSFPDKAAGGIRVSLTRASSRRFFGGKITPACALIVYSFATMSRQDGEMQIGCNDERVLLPSAGQSSLPNHCGAREYIQDDVCPPSGKEPDEPPGCGDDEINTQGADQ